jgi:hypothetical protein
VRLAGQGARSPGGAVGEVIGGLLADTTAATVGDPWAACQSVLSSRSLKRTLTVSPASLPIALRRSALTGSLWVPSPNAMNELRKGCPSIVPRTFTSPRVPNDDITIEETSRRGCDALPGGPVSAGAGLVGGTDGARRPGRRLLKVLADLPIAARDEIDQVTAEPSMAQVPH